MSDHSVVLTNQYGIDVPQPLSDACDGRLTMLGSGSMTDQIRSLGATDGPLRPCRTAHPSVRRRAGCRLRWKSTPAPHLVGEPFRPCLLARPQCGGPAHQSPARVEALIAFDRRTYSRDLFARLAIPLDEPAPDEPAGWDMRSSLGIPNKTQSSPPSPSPTSMRPQPAPASWNWCGSSWSECRRATWWRWAQRVSHHNGAACHGNFPPGSICWAPEPTTDRFSSAPMSISTHFRFPQLPPCWRPCLLHGLPVITMSNESNGPLNFDDFGLDPRPVPSSEGWLERAELWCRDIALGKTVGSEMQQSVRSVHGGTAWIDQLETLYSMPWGRSPLPNTGRINQAPAVRRIDLPTSSLRVV